jgi:putative transposase
MDGSVVLNEAGRIVDECWLATPAHFDGVESITHVVMPNHVHGIILIRDIAKQGAVTKASPLVGARHASPLRPHGVKRHSLGAIIGSFKSAVTNRIGRELSSTPVWQRNYYEHIIRNERQMEKVWLYIQSNPLCWATDEENPAMASAAFAR